jgi:hypothetical protein
VAFGLWVQARLEAIDASAESLFYPVDEFVVAGEESDDKGGRAWKPEGTVVHRRGKPARSNRYRPGESRKPSAGTRRFYWHPAMTATNETRIRRGEREEVNEYRQRVRDRSMSE